MPLIVIVALPEPIPIGASFDRREWPAHVTLAPNFRVDEPHPSVDRAVREVCAGEGPLSLRFAEEAHFGPERDIAVQLVDSVRIVALHERLAELVQRLPGFGAQEPEHWRSGYRPHMTHVRGVATPPNASLMLTHVAIGELTRSHATICAAFAL